MKSSIVKRSIALSGHKTSVSLEDSFWQSLKEFAEIDALSLSALVHRVDLSRGQGNLSSALRQYVLGRYGDIVRQLQPAASIAPARPAQPDQHAGQ